MADALHRLLEVQDVDLAVDRLRHRRETLPARAELEAAKSAASDLDARIDGLRARLGELASTQQRLEGELVALEEREAKEQGRLYGGTITVPRELEALQSEITALARTRGVREDDLLEVKEATEGPRAEVATLEGERDRREREVAGIVGRLGEEESAIDAELGGLVGERARLVEEVPADLLATYERIRVRKDGIGAARLEGNRCSGCHLTLPATELDALRRAPEGTVVTHEECGRILVR